MRASMKMRTDSETQEMRSNTDHKTIAVNNPGGQPRQFCVQIQVGNQNLWKRSAVFLNQKSAEQCSLDLQTQGKVTRVVHYRLPTAA